MPCSARCCGRTATTAGKSRGRWSATSFRQGIEPSRRIEKRTETGTQFIWIYRQYTESYEGSDFAGYRRRIYYDPRTGRHFVSLEPCYVDVYREEAEEALRIVFENGRVKVIEELKR